MKDTKLHKDLINNINEYTKLFCEKHDLYFDYWVADLVGGICCFSNDYFAGFDDIRLDLENEVPKDVFFEWYDLTLDLGLKGKPTISYYLYLNKLIQYINRLIQYQ